MQHELCMRIEVQIPNDAAERLRQLATEGIVEPLRTLGIRAIQLENDSKISLDVSGQVTEEILLENLANGSERSEAPLCKIKNSYANINNGPKTENSNNFLGSSSHVKQSPNIGFFQLPQVNVQHKVYLQQQQHLQSANIPTNIGTASGVSGEVLLSLQQQQILQQRRNIMLGGPSTSSVMIKQKLEAYNNTMICKSNFKSPNTVCPMEGKIPKPPNMQMCTFKNFNVREFPFESMRQARVLQGRDNVLNAVAGTSDGLLPVAKPALPRLQDQHLVNTLVPPPNVALKIIKNPQSAEMITTINANKFLQPPPPPYPGMSNTSTASALGPGIVAKPFHNYSKVMSNQNSKDIAMSSPLLVNLLQNDSNLSVSAVLQENQVNLLPSPPNLPQQPLLQHSPLLEIISPKEQQQHQIISSPMRSTSTPNNDFIIPQREHILSNVNNVPDIVLNVPLTPKANVLQQRTQRSQQQQIIFSLYSQQQRLLSQQQQQRSLHRQQEMQQHQQQELLQQEPQQLTQFSFQQQQHEAMVADSMCTSQQQHNQHLWVSAIGSGQLHYNEQFHSPLQTHPIITTQQQQQQYISTNVGGISPPTPKSSVSNHHSLHRPYINPLQHPQNLLSLPSTIPVQSRNNPPLTQVAQKLSHSSASPTLLHNAANIQLHTVSSYPSALAAKGNYTDSPLPPDYNQAEALMSKWPASNKTMDSATKSSYQEFTRYQKKYIELQSQQQQTQLSYISEMSNSLSGTTNTQHQHFISETSTAASTPPPCTEMCDDREKANGATNDSLYDLPDPLISLSDLDGLTANDLEALLPTLAYDVDTTLSLDDKNELELLLQDAKDLDLDMIEENLSAVGMDINETASSLLGSDAEIPPNVILEMDHVADTETQKQQQQTITSEQMFQTQQQWQKSQQQRYQQQVHNETMVNQLTRQQKQEQPISKEHLHKLPELQEQMQINDNLVQNEQQFFVESNRPQHYKLLKIQSNWINGITPTSISNAITNNNISTVTAIATLSNSTNKNSINLTISSTTNNSTHSIQPKQFLINPLTGELEPSISDDDNSETEAEQKTKQQKLSSNVAIFQKTNSDFLNYNRESHATYKSGIKLDPTNQLTITDQTEMRSVKPFPHGLGMTDKIKNLNFTTKNKLQKRKGLSKIMATMCNGLDDEGAKGSPRLTITSQTLFNHNSNVLTDNNNITTTTSNKSSKTILLREKLQQGLKEKKNKDVNAKSFTLLKTKRERTKTSNKYNKSNLTIIVTTSDLTSARNSAITNSSATITTLTASTATIETSSITPTSGEMSSAKSSDSNVEMESNQKQRLHINTHILQKQHQQQQMFINKTQIMEDNIQKQLLNNFTTPCLTTVATKATTTKDEPRVPPLHISLKGGKNSIVIKNAHKEGKKGHSSSHPYETKTAEDDTLTKRKVQFKRNHVFSIPTSNSSSYLKEDDLVNKHSKILNPRVTPTSLVNGAPSNFHNKSTKLESSYVSSTLLAGKNELTKSTLNTLESTKNQYLKDNNTTMSSSTNNILGYTSVGTIISNKATNTQPQLTKITTLPNSITLNTKTTNESSGPPSMTPSNSVGDSNVLSASRTFNNVQLKHNLKTTSTITPLGCKPKPPLYVTTVQHLKKQKQLSTLNEKQTQQQMIAAAVTMLPSATTLKRVEITKVEGKYSSGKIIEHILLKPNQAIVSTTAAKTGITHNYNPLLITNIPTAPINNQQSNKNENVCDKLEECATSVYSNESITTSSGVNDVNLRDTILAKTCRSINVVTSIAALTTNAQRNSPSNIIREKTMAHLTGGGNGNGTNGAAEDSGIESMDALSEKSPHQAPSCSPQPTLHIRLPLDEKFDNPITSKAVREEFKGCKSTSILTNSLQVLNSNQISLADDEIEKALAKMEGFIEDETCMREKQIATAMEPIIVDKSDLNFISKSEKWKINSKFNVLLLDDHIKSDFYNGVLEKDDDDDDNLMKNLTTSILEEYQEKLAVKTTFHEAKLTTSRTKENAIPITHTKHETQANNCDSVITNTNKMAVLININDNETNKGLATAIYHNSNNKIMEKRLEKHLERSSERKKIDRKKSNTIELIENREKLDTGKMTNNESMGQNPMSIEIPTKGGIDLPFVRTRARSRLTTLLDSVTKGGPPSVFAALEQVTTKKHISASRSTVHSDCISVRPKTNDVSTFTSGATTYVPVTSIHDNNKRKRPESDLFAPHGESEIKRSYSGSMVGFNIALNRENSNASNNRKILDTYEGKDKKEESSDSDEPLIEIAGKGRTSKVTNATIPNHITFSMDTNAKLSRSGRTFQQQNKMSHNNPTAIIAENIRLPPSTNVSNSEGREMCGKPLTMFAANGNSVSILDAGETMLFAAAHMSRGVVSPNNNSSATYSNNNTNCDNGTNDIEIISTRRSVRTSAATNKIAFIRNGSSNEGNSAIFTHSNITEISKNAMTIFPKNCATVPESLSEARRKTRCAIGIGET